MNEFLESIIERDPAAKSKLSVILTYPGVKAMFMHRIANFFAIAKFDLIARIISNACLDGASRASGLGSKKDGPVILRKSEIEESNDPSTEGENEEATTEPSSEKEAKDEDLLANSEEK